MSRLGGLHGADLAGHRGRLPRDGARRQSPREPTRGSPADSLTATLKRREALSSASRHAPRPRLPPQIKSPPRRRGARGVRRQDTETSPRSPRPREGHPAPHPLGRSVEGGGVRGPRSRAQSFVMTEQAGDLGTHFPVRGPAGREDRGSPWAS